MPGLVTRSEIGTALPQVLRTESQMLAA